MFGRLPDAGGDGLHLGLPVDRAAFPERFRAQRREQSLVNRVDRDTTKGGFTDELAAAPGTTIAVEIDGSQASCRRHLPTGLGNPIGINLAALVDEREWS